MDPVSQVLAQQQSGSAEGQGFGQFYAEGKRLAQQQQNLNLSSQRLRLEQQQETRLQKESDILTPIRAKLMQNQSVNLGVEAAANQEKYNAITHSNAALPDIYALESAFLQSPQGFSDPNLRQVLLEKSKQNPVAYSPAGPGGKLWLQVNGPVVFEQQMQRVLDAEKRLKGTGVSVQSVDENGGIRLMKETAQGAQPGQLSPLGKAIADKKALEAAGDTESVTALNAAINKLSGGAEHAPSGLAKDLGVAKDLGIEYTPEELRSIVDVHLGIKAHAGTEKAHITKEDFIAKVYPKMRETVPSKVKDDDVVKQAGALYESIYSPASSAPSIKVGEVRKGYKFNGKFAPSDRRAWDKAE